MVLGDDDDERRECGFGGWKIISALSGAALKYYTCFGELENVRGKSDRMAIARKSLQKRSFLNKHWLVSFDIHMSFFTANRPLE